MDHVSWSLGLFEPYGGPGGPAQTVSQNVINYLFAGVLMLQPKPKPKPVDVG